MNSNFGGIEDKFAAYDTSKVLLRSIPYDGTSTWGKGADQGFDAFLDAARNMELYDIETDAEVFREGIHILPELSGFESPEDMVETVHAETARVLESDKFLTTFGGEHSISIGVIRAFYEKFPGISVLQLDAHTDLRPAYDGSAFNHACALYDASRHTNLVQAGIRSMDSVELPFLNREQCFFAQDIQTDMDWMDRVVGLLNEKVYITVDLDVFDPSVMPATGTPEPGGLHWYEVTGLLKKVFSEKEVVGFDIVELAPIEGLLAPQFLAAKLYYKMLSYKFYV